MCNETEKKYLVMRRKGLKEMKNLVYDRSILNDNIRKLRKEMEAWDRALITE